MLGLAAGPGFGLELIARVASLSGGLLRLNRGGAYLALRALERQGLVHGWMRRVPGAGRPRRYYELTPDGILRAEDIRRAFGALAQTASPAITPEQAQAMADRVNKGAGLSDFVIRLRDAGRRAGLS